MSRHEQSDEYNHNSNSSSSQSHGESSQKRSNTSNSARALGRRTSTDKAPIITSVYNEDKKEAPAWLKRDNPDDKYSKYGARKTHVSDETSDSRYSRYQTDDSVKPPKRQREESPEPDAKRQAYVIPYNNLDVANPSVDHRARNYQTFESHIKNRETGDINSIVRSHYNQRTVHSKHQGPRTNSPIYKLRNFNNAIKYILLGNNVRRDKNDKNKLFTLLDLCCGKGGDLNKCEFVEIEQYIGIDISDRSVEEAFSRYNQKRAKFKPLHGRDKNKFNFEACFATGDCFGQTIPEILEPNFPGIIDKTFPVDAVSIQFSLHYSFETEERVRTLITNISKSLRPGGTFIGTIPSSDFIRGKILKKEYISDETKMEKKKFGNSIYSVTFDKEPPVDGVFRPPFGNKYTYNLVDAVDNVPEYVVPFETLRSICEDYGLELKYKKNFIDIFNEEIPKYFTKLNNKLVEGMKRSDGKYGAEGDEKEAVGFYLGFVFEKLGA